MAASPAAAAAAATVAADDAMRDAFKEEIKKHTQGRGLASGDLKPFFSCLLHERSEDDIDILTRGILDSLGTANSADADALFDHVWTYLSSNSVSVCSSEPSAQAMKKQQPPRLRKCQTRPSNNEMFEDLRAYLRLQEKLTSTWERAAQNAPEAAEAMLKLNLAGSSVPWNDLSWRQTTLGSGRPVSTVDEAIEVAKVAHPIFKQLVEDVAEAVGIPPDEVAMEGHKSVEVAPLKLAQRVAEKATDFEIGPGKDRTEGPPVSWVMDLCRATIYVHDLSKFPEIWHALRKHKDVACIYNARNRFKDPPPPGYRDWNLEFQLHVRAREVVHMVELQVHYVPIKKLILEGNSHGVYQKLRTFFRGGKDAVQKRLNLVKRVKECGDLDDLIAHAHVSDREELEALGELLELFSEQESLVKIRQAQVQAATTTFGEDSPEVAAALDGLVMALVAEDDFDEAEARVMDCQAIRVKTDDAVGIAHSMNRLALIRKRQGKLEGAEHFTRVSLASLETALPANNIDYAKSLNDLAELLKWRKQYKDAEPICRRSLEIMQSELGEHRNVARSLNDLAALHKKMGDYQNAAKLCQEGLDMRQRVLGLEHRDVCRSMCDLAGIHEKLGNFDEAEKLLRKSLEIRKMILGHDHLDTAFGMKDLAKCLLEVDSKSDEAEELLRKSLVIRQQKLGLEHPETLRVQKHLEDLTTQK